MKIDNYAKRNAGSAVYIAPECEIFTLTARRMICASEQKMTEKVVEEEGEW